jgi:hypothetical protein
MQVVQFFRRLFERDSAQTARRPARPRGRTRRDPELPANISCIAKIDSRRLPQRRAA